MKYRNRIIAVLMGTTMALSSVLPVMASDNNVAVTTVENLEVGYQSEAMGVETEQNVRFSWNMQSNLIGQSQVAYQIDVTDDGKITGLDEQVKALKESKPFLFKQEEKPNPKRGFFPLGGKQPDSGKDGNEGHMTMKEAIAAKLNLGAEGKE